MLTSDPELCLLAATDPPPKARKGLPLPSTRTDLQLGASAEQEPTLTPDGPSEALRPVSSLHRVPPLARSFPRRARQPQPVAVLPPGPWGFRVSCFQMRLCLPILGVTLS